MKVIVAYFKALFRHLRGENGKNITKIFSQDSWFPDGDINPDLPNKKPECQPLSRYFT
jgi:hypothetical protein